MRDDLIAKFGYMPLHAYDTFSLTLSLALELSRCTFLCVANESREVPSHPPKTIVKH